MKRAGALLSNAAIGAAVALGVLVLASSTPGMHRSALLLGSCAMAAAALFAHRIHGVDRRLCGLIAGACAAFAVRAILADGTPTSSPVALIFGVIGTALLVTALAGLMVQRYSHVPAGALGDAAPIAAAAWLLAWTTLVRPLLDSGVVSPTAAVAGGLFVPLVAVLLYMALILVSSHAQRPAALVLLTAAVIADLIGVLWRLLAVAHVASDQIVLGADALFVASFLLGAAAFLHPSIATLERPHDAGRPQGASTRLVLLTGCLGIPVLAVALTVPAGTTDRIVRVVSTVALIVAVVLRTISATRDLRRSHETLLHGAQTDPLTLLPNRELLITRVNEALAETWRSATMPTVCLVDVDRFKNINDSLGHASGDEVLRVVARRLRSVAPEWATVARLSADEFVVLDPRTASTAEAQALADTLLASFREPLGLRGGDVFITASIGVTSATAATTGSSTDLLNHANTAMYRAKEAGRGRIVMYDGSIKEREKRRLHLEAALYRALDRRELFLEYQPILDLDSRDVSGFEALMRWTMSDGAVVGPAEFIPIAEETGTIIPIGAWALLEALSELKSWIEQGHCSPDTTVSVNVSPRQLADASFPAVVAEALARSGMSGERLWLEITESVMISEPTLALETLVSLRDLGVRIALDDFGKGYSSLSVIQQFPLHRLKIDRQFVQGMADNDEDRQLVRTIILMGDSLGLDLVAEGVETLQQLRVLTELGCGKAQGYLISRPAPPAAIAATVSGLHRSSVLATLLDT